MQFEFQDKIYTFPAQLSDITLGQRVAFFAAHGELLEQMNKQAEEATDDFEKEAAYTLLNAVLAVREFAHYSGLSLDDVENTIDFSSVMDIYTVSTQLLREQEADIEVQPYYDWKGERWVIASPEVTPGGNMTFNEFLHGKEVVRQMAKLAKGKWDTLPYLCAIYLRKEQEPFSEALLTEGGERMGMMLELPLDIALAVGFFLSSTLSIYSSTLASSDPVAERESIQQPTLTTGAG